MRRAEVYKRNNQFLIHASSRTTDGVWILSEPCLAVAVEGHDAELQRGVRAALGGSREGVPHPVDWRGVGIPLLTLAGVKTWNAFSKQAANIGVTEEGSVIVLTPTRNLGPKGGFQPDPSKRITLDNEPDKLAPSLRLLFGPPE